MMAERDLARGMGDHRRREAVVVLPSPCDRCVHSPASAAPAALPDSTEQANSPSTHVQREVPAPPSGKGTEHASLALQATRSQSRPVRVLGLTAIVA